MNEIKKPTSLAKYASLSKDLVIDHLNSSQGGLTNTEAQIRLDEVGPNELSEGYKETIWSRLFEAVVNPFNIILMVIAIITLVTDILIASEKDYFTFVIILVLVFVSSAISFVQSQTSSRAVAELTKQLTNTTRVYRDGELIEIDQQEIVPGDIVHLGAGDLLPADLRFIQTKDTFVAQSALTGESTPVEKFAKTNEEEDVALTDLENIGFMGSNMVSGSAKALVLETGDRTYFGSMAQSLSGERAKNSFERGVEDISRLLIRMMIIMVPIVFVIK